MADENVIIEANEQNVGEYDPNPYDNVTVEEALKQLFNRFTPRTVRQAIFTMAENNKPATLIEKSITENGTYNASADKVDGYSKVTVDVAGGGGETFEVEIVTGSETPKSFTTDKSYDEVKAAIQANKVINVIYSIKEQGETLISGTTSAVDYNSEADFMSIVASIQYEGVSGYYAFQWGNPETYTQVSKVTQVLFSQIY